MFGLRLSGTVLALLMALVQSALAINSNAGTTGFNFLKIGVGARTAALGGANTALSGDLEVAASNPASLYDVRERTAALSLTSYLVDSEAGFISLALPGENRTWGIAVNYFTHGDLQRTDSEGRDQGTFGAFDMAAQITAAQKMWQRRLTVGASFKAIYSSIDDYTSDAYAVDLGVLAPGPIDGMTLGASLANIGSVRSGFTDSFEDSLPVLFKVGLSHRPAHAPVPMTLLADLNVPNDNDTYLTFGAELNLGKGLLVRPGYSMQQTGLDGEEAIGLTAGAGVALERYHVDYAFTSFPAFGDVHRISLNSTF
tara:strand:- start:3 stop:938 length:936 start_codon:yes stop_codon:yes gene_type:complete